MNTANKTDREIAKLLKGIDGQNRQLLSCLMNYIFNLERKVFKEVSKVSDIVLLSQDYDYALVYGNNGKRQSTDGCRRNSRQRKTPLKWNRKAIPMKKTKHFETKIRKYKIKTENG